MTKKDIRILSQDMNLPTWNKPAGACLLTRLPHGTLVDEAELARIDEGERFLRREGFPLVRLRSHGELANIQVSPEYITAVATPGKRRRIDEKLRSLGYRHVALDLAGYCMGSMNKPKPEHPAGHECRGEASARAER